MIFIALSVIMVAWSYRSLRQRPLREYAAIYFALAAIGCIAECTVLGIWHPWETHMHIRPDRIQDVHITEAVTKAFIFPFMGLIYQHYMGRRPVLMAAVAALATGAMERLFIATGNMEIYRWSTWITVAMFFVYYLLVWQISRRQMPLWLHTGSFAMAAGYVTLQLILGFGLWKFRLPVLDPAQTDIFFLITSNLLLVGPAVTVTALAPALRGAAGVAAVTIFLVLAEQVLKYFGILVHVNWNPVLSGLRYLLFIVAAFAYVKWQTGERPRAAIQ